MIPAILSGSRTTDVCGPLKSCSRDIGTELPVQTPSSSIFPNFNQYCACHIYQKSPDEILLADL